MFSPQVLRSRTKRIDSQRLFPAAISDADALSDRPISESQRLRESLH
jgi:hypothetical protein